MSAASIQAKIRAGLARAVSKTGSASSEKVYLVSETGGGGDPINPIPTVKTDIELINAIFTSYDISLIGGNIQIGDRQLISDNSVAIPTGATIKQGTTNYIVIGPSPVAPTSDVLIYKTQVRVQ